MEGRSEGKGDYIGGNERREEKKADNLGEGDMGGAEKREVKSEKNLGKKGNIWEGMSGEKMRKEVI